MDQVQDIVAGNDRVKALGTRHSFSDVADTPGEHVVLDRIPPDIVIDSETRMVTVGAGASYGVLANHLHTNGWALDNLASLPHISIAGGIATATHGSGDTNRILSASVAALELVTTDGSLITVDRSRPDLAALAVGLGVFGIVTRVTLDIEPTYEVRQDIYVDASWEEVLASFDEVMASAYSVCLLGSVAGPDIGRLWLKRRLDRDPTPPLPELFGGRPLAPSDLRPGNSLTAVGVPGPWSERLAHFRLNGIPSAGGDELQSEYFVDRRHAVAALEAVRGMGEAITPHLHGAEIRTVAADDLWMSPAYGRDTLAIGFTWRKHPAEVAALLPDLEAALAPYDPRPHLGKLFAIDDLGAAFPRLGDFLALAADYDPSGKFGNRFTERLAGAAG